MKALRRIARYLWLAIATFTILLAVVVSLARALLPYLDGYRSTLETRVSGYLGQPVSIEQLDARLLGLTPTIIFRKVALKSTEKGQPIAHLDEIRIGLDLYASLQERAPVFSELVVAGARMAAVRHRDGSFSIEGIQAARRQEDTTGDGATLGNWLLVQGRLRVQDSTLVWRDEMRNTSLHFEHVDIELVNSGERHRLNGYVVLPEGGGKSLRIALDVNGNPLAGVEWSGMVYAKADALHPTWWLPMVSAQMPDLPVKSGEISAEVWSEWEQGTPVRSEGNFLIRDARLHSAKSKPATVRELSGEFLWQSDEAGWTLDMQQVRLQVHGDGKGLSRIHLSHQNEGDLLLADHLRVEDVATLMSHAPVLSDEQLNLLNTLAPRGEVRRLRIERGLGGVFETQGEFYALGMDPWEAVPGIDGATGRWRAGTQGGEIFLDSRDAHFSAPRLFRAPLQIGSLSAMLTVRPMEEGWRLEGRNIAVSNKDIAARGDLDMQFEKGRKPYLDLRVAFWNGQAKQVPHYVPAKIMGEGSVGWLDGAFGGGVVSNGTVLFHGRTADFPFDGYEGIFETRFQAEDITLAFASDWPRLENVSGEVLFQNQRMEITPRQATLFSTGIEEAKVVIPVLKEPVLHVDIIASPPAGDVLRLFRETPLAVHMGSALSGMEASGKSSMKLSLRLPLSKSMAEKSPLHYEGTVKLHDARLQVLKGVAFRQMAGTVTFNDTNFRSTDLRGELFDEPVTMDIHTDDTSRTVIAARGHLMADTVRRHVQLPLIEHLDGGSDWRGLLYLPRGEGAHPSMEFHSSLSGMALQLPAPAGKQRDEQVPVTVRVAFGEETSKRVSVSYGDRGSARLVLVGEDMTVQRAALHFGSGGASLPKSDGWYISGTLEKFDWDRWNDLLPSSEGTSRNLPLTIDMNRLSLKPRDESAASGAVLRPEKFPQLDLHVRDLTYDDWHLGEVTGSSRSDSHHWEISNLRAVAPTHDIRLSANWREGQRSHLDLTASSNNIEEMLRAFGMVSMISRGKGVVTGKLGWDGVLSEISWGGVDGNLAVKLTEGALVDVDPGAGRLFGLLSLQALPRRLTLDFRDLFQKGLQFDEIKGDIRVMGGNAITNNLYVNSPSAGILVEGRTGLVRRDYDQIVTVVPNVSSSVSIASAIAWGPQVAAAVLLLQNVFKKDIAKVTMIRYSVKGSWDSPQFNRLEQPVEVAKPVIPE